MYLRYKGTNKRGFCCGGKKAQDVWDVKLPENIVKIFSIENQPGVKLGVWIKDY